MGIFNKIFGINDKSKSEGTNQVKSNPAFEYIEENNKIDCSIYRKLAESIYSNATSAAEQFAYALNKNSNEELIHFFFDYFLFFFSIARRKSLPKENDVYSAILDGIHIEYYGNVNRDIIDSTIKLMATNEFCFLKTNYHLYEKSNIRMSITIAAYCVLKPNIPGATEIIELKEKLHQIHKEKLKNIDNSFKMLKIK